jgi:hypothetical protein
VQPFPFRQSLRDDLVRAIRQHQDTRPRVRRRWVAVGIAAACVAALAAVFAWSSLKGTDQTSSQVAGAQPESNASRGSNPQPSDIVGLDAPHSGLAPVTLQKAEQQAPFELLVPNDPAANVNNMTGVFAEPQGHPVQMEFPPPDDTSKDLTQPFISVYEDSWPGTYVGSGESTDPLAFAKQDVTADPDSGKSLCSIGDLPAVCVEPRSASDSTHSNPAYVRVVNGDVAIELTGGDDLDALRSIAASLTGQ